MRGGQEDREGEEVNTGEEGSGGRREWRRKEGRTGGEGSGEGEERVGSMRGSLGQNS